MLIILLSLTPSASAQSLLAVGDACPGPMTITLAGLTPDGPYALVTANGTGALEVPRGPCAGTTTGLSANGIAVRVQRTADSDGRDSLAPTIPAGACGVSLQALDLTTCGMTNVTQFADYPSSCTDALARGFTTTGPLPIDPGDGLGPVELVCDQDTEGGGWVDLVASMHLPGADVDALLARFFQTNGVNGTQISVGLGDDLSGAPGFHIDNDAYSVDHTQGFHLLTTLAFSSARLTYRMQGAQADRNRCSESLWIPLNGPGYEGGNSGYLSPCVDGYSCIQGSATASQDTPIFVTASFDDLAATDLLTWSGSNTGPVSDDCARDPEIPTDHPTTFFTQLLIR